MNDTLGNPAFQEFLQKKCEDILTNDKEYSEINNRITQLESEINVLASGELLKKVSEYEKLSTDSVAYAVELVCCHTIKDFKGIT